MANNNSNQRYEIMVTIYTDFDPVSGKPLGDGTKYMLETYESEMVTFDGSINDIQDISQRNSTYSKTLTLPDSDHNRVAFGYISNLITDSNLFNPNRRADCQILVDSIVVYTGTLQLKRVLQNYKSGEKKLECVFFSSVNDFYKNMNELYLTNLTGLNRYNHIYNADSITKSWTQSVTNGYYYPLIDYGREYSSSDQEIASGFNYINMGGYGYSTHSIITNQMYPAVYAKVIVDEIFSTTGYQYDSNFLNSEFFSNLIIPFTNKRLTSPYIIYDNFYGYPSNNYVITKNQANLYNTGQGSYKLVVETYNIFHTIDISNSVSTGGPVSYTMSVAQCYYESPYGQVNDYGFWASTQTYTEINYPFKNNKSVSVGISPSIKINFTGTQSSYNEFDTLLNIPDAFGFRPTLFFSFCSKKVGQPVKVLKVATGYDLFPEYFSTNSQNFNIFNMQIVSKIANWQNGKSGNFFNGENYSVDPGEECFIMINNMYFINGGAPSIFYEFISSQISTYITWSDNILRIGGLLDIPSNLPANIKQKDFMTSLYKMFNLYVEPDKQYTNLLRIEPRDDYYRYDKVTGKTVVKDWTSKIDLDQQIDMDILSDTQSKTIRYTYKNGKDYFNSYYKNITNRIQGDSIQEVDNDFSSGDKKIEVIFESSVLANIPGFNNFPVVNLAKQISETLHYPVGSTDTAIKILQKSSNGVVNLSSDLFWHFESATYSYYPYAGTYDNPYAPSVDINFDQQLVHFWYQPDVVNDNLFNTYYKNQFDELSDVNSRLLTCEMYLTPVDMNDFYFSNLIYIELGGQGGYWRVNSIKNYDVSGRSTCTVELITAKDYILP
jgi:hypothetical protein